MNIRDLEYLSKLAELRHFHKAAAAVNVSQPTLSGQIRKLEELLGVTLFERNSRNVMPTPAGKLILKEAESILEHVRAIKEIALAHRDPLVGSFRLGIIASLGPFLAPDLLQSLQVRAPLLEVVIHEALTEELLASLQAWQLDAAILATPPSNEDLLDIPLFNEPFLLAHAPQHPLGQLDNPSIEDMEKGELLLLADGHCLRDQALALCGAKAMDKRVQASSLLTLMRLAASGQGTTLVPALAAAFASGLRLRKLGDAKAHRQIRLVARSFSPRRIAVRTIAEIVKKIAQDKGMDCN